MASPAAEQDDGHAQGSIGRVETAPLAQPSDGIMIDVGDGYGALVLYADADRVGLEPEIHPVGLPAERQHVWVLERASRGSGRVFAAVFPSLPAGRYAICPSAGGAAVREVDVPDGAVAEAHWD